MFFLLMHIGKLSLAQEMGLSALILSFKDLLAISNGEKIVHPEKGFPKENAGKDFMSH